MAEPAYKLPEEDQPDIKPHVPALHGIEGGEEVSEPRRGHLSSVPTEAGASSVSPEEIAKAEAGDKAADTTTNPQAANELESLYHPDSATVSRSFWRLRGLSGRKKLLIGLGSGAGIAGLFISAFLSLLPLKINHIVNNLQSRFFASSESAVSRRSEVLLSNYVMKKVLPSLSSNCPSTRTNKSCINAIAGETPAAKLYRGWKDANLENKLANKYGIEFERTKDNQYSLKVNGNKSPIDLTGFRQDPNGLWVGIGDRNDIRQQVKKAFANETKWKQVMYRFKVGRLLERKYGIRRCLFFCKVTDKFDAWKDNKKGAAKTLIVRKVVMPHTDTLGIALGCIFDPESSCGASAGTDSDGARQDKFQKEIRQYLQKFGVEATNETVSEVAKKVESILKSGSLTKYIVDEVVKKVTNGTIKKAGSKGLPIIGYIDMAATVITKLHNAGPQLKKWAFVTNAAAMVSLYVMYRSHADELKNGKVDPALLGSMVNTLSDSAGSNNAYGEGKSNLGQSAEVSPLYSNLLGTSSSPSTSLLNILSPSAYAAASTSSSKYTCDNGGSTQAGKLICPEESLVTDNFLTQLSDAFNKPPLSALSGVADFWKSSAGAVLGALGKALSWLVEPALHIIPGYDSAVSAMSDALGSFFQQVAQWLIPSPISNDMSGARAFNMMAGGADVSGNDFAQFGTGAAQITNKQAADIRNQQEVEARQQFASKSFFSRMFDQTDSHSMVSQVAMSLPTSKSQALQGTFSSFVSNPFSKLLNGFGSLLSRPRAYAANSVDPFGVPQYGYALDDATINQDPDIYTDAYCKQMNDDWANGTGDFKDTITTDPDTGMDIHTKANPCMLEQAATGSAGGLFTNDVLTKADLTEPGGGSATTSPALNGNVYILGDSLTEGMKTSGNLAGSLQTQGWSSTIMAECGRRLASDGNNCSNQPIFGGLSQVDQPADQAAIKSAGVVVVGLGTNDPGSTTYGDDVKNMVSKIKSLNPSVKIYWVNLFSTDDKAAAYQAMNGVLSGVAGNAGFTVMDWATQAPKVDAYAPGTYHPSNYQAMTDFVVSQLGRAP